MQIKQIYTLSTSDTTGSKTSGKTPSEYRDSLIHKDSYTPSFGEDPKIFDFKSRFFLLFLGSAFGAMIFPPAGILAAAIFGTAWLGHTAGVIIKGGAEFGERKVNYFFNKKIPEVFAVGGPAAGGKKAAAADAAAAKKGN